MKQCFEMFCMVLLAAPARSNEVPESQETRSVTSVVSQAFCESTLPAEDKGAKKTLEEVHTYAELKHDPRASLPDSFTVCSSILTTGCGSDRWSTFFTILDNNKTQLLAPMYKHGMYKNGSIESLFMLTFSKTTSGMVIGKTSSMFPNQWIKSCLAINTTSGLIHWVVEGTLILTMISEEVKKSQIRDLRKKVVLGSRSYTDIWYAVSQKVANLNIFASALSIEMMESMTKGGSCVKEEGDYLAWGDMEWILHGQARIETTEKEEISNEKALVDLYYTPFPGMDSCMHHCENLGSRVPSVATFQEWTKHSGLKWGVRWGVSQ